MASVGALLWLFLPHGAPAQTVDSGFRVDPFETQPALDTNLVNVSTSRVLGHLQPSAGLLLHFSDDLLVLRRQPSGETIEKLVDSRLNADIAVALGLFDMLEVGLVLPTVPYQSGRFTVDPDGAGADFSTLAIGDLRLVPKINIIDPDDTGHIGMAAQVTVNLPTGEQESFNSDGAIGAEGRLIFDWTHPSFAVSANVGVAMREDNTLVDYSSTDSLQWGLASIVPLDRFVSVMAGVYGSTVLDSADAPSTPVELWAGGRYGTPVGIMAQAGLGAGVTGGVGAPVVRVFAGVAYSGPVQADADRDGIPDTDDQCPDDPEDDDDFEDADGCPDPDNDRDGLEDTRDACPDTPEDRDGFEDLDGCPDLDNDNDGVRDVRDGELGGSGFGICRNSPEDLDGFEDEDGCPDPDNDRDGIPDLADGELDARGFGRCRNTPETKNGYLDEDGCPDEKPRAVLTDRGTIDIMEKVYFEFDRDVIQPRSYSVLDDVARIMREHPELTRVRVEGHTDDRGGSAYNRDLSARRAAAVMRYLIDEGIDPDRLDSRGFGEDRPIATNDTDEGRTRNRRVEFKILRTE